MHAQRNIKSSANVETNGRRDLPLDTTGTLQLPTFRRILVLPSS